MAPINPPKVIFRVRRRLKLSQEGLSRLLNATKGAIQHWERGRNRPDLGRLLALRQICPPGEERRELDGLIRQVQEHVAPVMLGIGGRGGQGVTTVRPRRTPGAPSQESLLLLRRENVRLEKLVAKLQEDLHRQREHARIMEAVATDAKREAADLRAKQISKPNRPVEPVPPPAG